MEGRNLASRGGRVRMREKEAGEQKWSGSRMKDGERY